jgi:hypothetical protein
LFETLASANNFSREELEMNRAGQFSDLQKKRLLRKGLEFAALFLGSVLLVLTPMFSKLRDLSWGSIVFFLFVFAIFLFGFGWKAITIFVDLWNQKAISVQSSVVALKEPTRYGRSYFYTTGTHRFSVSEKAYHALVPQEYYRIFYAPYSMELVSIEPIRSHRQR